MLNPRDSLLTINGIYPMQEEGRSYVPNPHFEDDVLFVNGVHADTSFVILDS